MSTLTILILTCQRTTALAATLTSLISQTFKDFDIVISEQSRQSSFLNPSIQTVVRILSTTHFVSLMSTPPKGIAHHRQTLLNSVTSKYVLFLDDDLILESFVVDYLMQTIQEHQCGFVGMAPIGLSYSNDVRPAEQEIELCTEVKPEIVKVNSKEWERYKVHNAANILHAAKKVTAKKALYKVAWIGGCVLYDREKLIDVGGFEFWKDLPRYHAGEDVLAELRVMAKYGGCGILPSGVYHQEYPTTLPHRPIDAPKVFS